MNTPVFKSEIIFSLLTSIAHLVFGRQLIGAKFTSQTNVIMDAQRLIHAFDPFRQNLLDDSPGADGFDEYFLVLVKQGLGHDTSSLSLIRAYAKSVRIR